MDDKERVFTTIQTFLKNPPTIIWGSGATVALGLPAMGTLNAVLKKEIPGFNASDENLEIELGKPEYESQLPKIRKVIWNAVNQADIKVLKELIHNNNCTAFVGIKNMVETFRETHPRVVNIITTNYDRVLEHVMAFQNIPFSDGFEGRELSLFNEQLFRDKDITNLIKVHGSLNWFQIDGSIRYLNHTNDEIEPTIICPGKNKYEEAYSRPYRELIQKADNLIDQASSFLIVGFGFNDAHLTPKIREKVRSGTPLVLITKEVTESCRNELKNARKYILLQESASGHTNIILKANDNTPIEKLTLDGDYWKLDKFMEIL